MTVGVVAATVTGAATGVGEGAGTAVVEMVRARLATSERGRAALEHLDADATDPAARAETRDTLVEEIEADPELRRRLTVHLSAPTTHTTGSVVITDSTVSRSHISLGPLTINNTSGGRAVLAVGIALLVALLALGAYGGVQMLASDDAPKSSASSAPPASPAPSAPSPSQTSSGPDDGGAGSGESSEPTGTTEGDGSTSESSIPEPPDPPWDPDLPLRSLPAPGDMPAKWEALQSPGAIRDEDFCDTADAVYTSTDGYRATFMADGCPTPDEAQGFYEEAVKRLREDTNFTITPMTVEALGDERAAYERHPKSIYATEKSIKTVIRVDKIVLSVLYSGVASDSKLPAELQNLTRLFVEKAQRQLSSH